MRRAGLATAASIALLLGAPAAAHAGAPSTPPNAIVRENALAGSPDWQRQQGGDIQVYGTEIGGRPGDAIHLHVSTAWRYRVLVYRLGWYAGAGAREVACLPDCSSDEQGRAQPVPPSPVSALEPPLRAGWPVTDTVQTDPSWTTGYYLVEALLTNGPSPGRVATTFFVLREPDASPGSRILVQVPVNTWEAYNAWDGHSLYDVNGGRVYRVSFERPWGPFSQSPFWWEIQLVRFLEREGYDVSYQTDLDTDRDPGSLVRHRLVVVAGHDEYWTMSMRDAFDAAVAQGTNLAFMGSNAAYWHIEYEDDGQTIFGYKSLYDPNPVLAQKTALWREIGRPECMLMGVQHQFITQTPHQLDYTVVAPSGDPWLAGTGLNPGDTISGVVGREHDVINPFPEACFHPGLTILFHYDGHGVDQNADAVRFTAPSGARVFASGAQELSWALDDWRPDGGISSQVPVEADRYAPADPRIQQFMRNALADLTRPAAPQQLTATSSDRTVNVTIAASPDPRVLGFVARVRVGSRWRPLCRGVTTCTGFLPKGSYGPMVVGAVALDGTNRSSAPDYVVTSTSQR